MTMTSARRLAIALLAAFMAPALPAQISASYSANPNLGIPDGSTVGVVSTIQVTGSSILEVSSIQVNLNISGGFNGDYHAYLVHTLPNGNPAGIVTLLNRTGRTSGNAFGYGDSGFNVSFADGAVNGDIHLYQLINNPGGGSLSGLWQPDGRPDSPFTVTDGSPRSEFLSAFNGVAADGTWSLFIADVSGLGTGTFVSWGMTIVGVPEPSTWAAGVLGLATCAWLRRRR